ncbi:MAG: cytochrome c [Gammaproteobacteria bacterium]|nr:cytochrome c [Gammaproteobacteria bacterium]
MLITCSAIADRSIPPSRQLYLNNLLIQDCGSCHGLTMKGGLGPALLPDSLKGKPAAFITTTILDGRPGTAMPAWRALLSAEEAAWLTSKLLSGNL